MPVSVEALTRRNCEWLIKAVIVYLMVVATWKAVHGTEVQATEVVEPVVELEVVDPRSPFLLALFWLWLANCL